MMKSAADQLEETLAGGDELQRGYMPLNAALGLWRMSPHEFALAPCEAAGSGDALRPRHADRGHPVQRAHRDARLDALRVEAARAQPGAEHALQPREGPLGRILEASAPAGATLRRHLAGTLDDAPTSGEKRPAQPALAPRELAVLRLLAEGCTNKEMARALAIGPETVKSHLKHIYDKLSVERRMQAVLKAQSLGLLPTA
jgi:DNA-binding CsgD family transcriptional regulator